jgi:hypothetical protein
LTLILIRSSDFEESAARSGARQGAQPDRAGGEAAEAGEAAPAGARTS